MCFKNKRKLQGTCAGEEGGGISCFFHTKRQVLMETLSKRKNRIPYFPPPTQKQGRFSEDLKVFHKTTVTPTYVLLGTTKNKYM